MKKVLVMSIMAALCICIATSGCSNKEDVFDSIVEAIRTEDKETLKGFFSEQAINDCKDIDLSINYLFDYIQGNIVKIEYDKLNEERSKDYGKVQISIRKWYKIETSEENYVLFLLVHERDDENPANKGLYMVMICREGEDKAEPYLYPGIETLCAGVYMPE